MLDVHSLGVSRRLQYKFYVPKSKQTYLPRKPEAPKMATLTPAFDERPPGPASVARFAVTRGKKVENARWGTATRLNADNMVAPRLKRFVRRATHEAE